MPGFSRKALPVVLALAVAAGAWTPGRPAAAALPGGVGVRVLQRGTSQAYVATVRLGSTARAVPVLSNDALAGFETTSSMAARTGAVVAVNGDFALPSGRPVHAFATGGVLAQTAQLPGRGAGLDRSGHRVDLGFPTVGVRISAGGATLPVAGWNSGPPRDGGIVGFTAAGAGLDAAPGGSCYALLAHRSGPEVGPGGARSELQVGSVRCASAAPRVPPGAVLLVARPAGPGAARLRRLVTGRVVTMTQQLGFGPAWALLGASEGLVKGGRVNAVDVDGPGDYVQGDQPRTALGVTADARLLLVVVDGRQPGYSTGMSLRALAELMVSLGAREAVNLDGGGSSTMWVDGRVVNRPSDGSERPVSSALVVLPRPMAPRPYVPDAQAADAWQRMAADPGSSGGLLGLSPDGPGHPAP